MTHIRSFEGRCPKIDPSAWVDETAVVIGEVTLGAEASVWPGCVIRGDIHRIEIGARTNIQDGSVLHVSHESRFMPGGAPVVVHEDVTVGHQVVLHGCEIRHHCLIGIGARVLDRALLEPFTLLGAGSLVTPGQVLEGGYLWLGAPARRVRALTDREREYLVYVAQNYVRLADRYRAESTHAATQ
ncbi:gamma carbonic anhydrase family protein [Thiocapsa marina]|uniref:Transferase hexapeptide repeat containing protein n=1 Tax=Thiocapsa marina 5811 TaxID=768671 RepID=F9UGX8_9GAMM|nr:gamma carbonic anhydrase family protein [Thiocapsa marina]EGV16598.1 transferase hexapeptide repeat containing protein [Thiocapsa marina 5811]